MKPLSNPSTANKPQKKYSKLKSYNVNDTSIKKNSLNTS